MISIKDYEKLTATKTIFAQNKKLHQKMIKVFDV